MLSYYIPGKYVLIRHGSAYVYLSTPEVGARELCRLKANLSYTAEGSCLRNLRTGDILQWLSPCQVLCSTINTEKVKKQTNKNPSSSMLINENQERCVMSV